MKIINVMQGSSDWLAVRAGRITGSRMIDVLALTKPKTALCIVDPATGAIAKKLGNGVRAETAADKLRKTGVNVEDVVVEPPQPLQARIDYTLQIAWERFAGVPQLQRETIEMRWGKDCEDYARFHYEARTGVPVKTVGFCALEADYVGISPDGLVRDDGGIEIKCPYNGRVHMETWLQGMPEDHMPQIQAAMWVTDRPWWDFVSFDPRVPKEKRLYIQTIRRDEVFIAKLAQECAAVHAEAESVLNQVRGKAAAFSQMANNFEAVPGAIPHHVPTPDLPPARIPGSQS